MKFDDDVAVATALLSTEEFWFIIETVYVTSIPEEAKSALPLILPPLSDGVTDVMLIWSVDTD